MFGERSGAGGRKVLDRCEAGLIALEERHLFFEAFGYRAKDAASLHVQLYAPRAGHEWSIMPAFRHLYTVQKIQAVK